MIPEAARKRGLALAGVAATVHAAAWFGLASDVAIVEEWFYSLAWWSYILLADGLVHARLGRSLLLSRPRAFLALLPWSCAFWLFFELLNLRLQNWYYVGLPTARADRIVGMAIAFSTVLPGIFESADLLRAIGAGRSGKSPRAPARLRRWAAAARTPRLLLMAGAACLALPLLQPRWFFPLVWVAILFLGEGLLARRGARSFTTEAAAGRTGTALRMLGAGLLTGLLWESWNWDATSRWIYTVPFFEGGKLFEMPLPGILGFLPFALEAWVFARVLAHFGWLPEWELQLGAPAHAPKRWVPAALLAVAVSLPLLFLTDLRSVRGTVPRTADLSVIDADQVRDFEERGLGRLRDLVAAADAGAATGLAPDLLAEARLMLVRGLGARGRCWLAHAGVHTIRSLADADPRTLIEALAGGTCPGPTPTPAEVRVWIAGARQSLAR